MQYDHSSNTKSLYIHWPFCPYKCHFCPFVALASHDQFMEQYHRALKKEIISFATKGETRLILDTIFFGGGTPSTYPPDLLLDMFGILKHMFDVAEHSEVSLEVNPGTATREKIQLWHQVGINRLSIGVQSLKDGVLQPLNRHHTAFEVETLVQEASVYFSNISVDLILGLPGVEPSDWKSMLAHVVEWPITHMSVYFLTVHEETPLYFKVKTNKVILPPDDEIVDLYYWTREFIAMHGFVGYELSNFAKPGYESRHNSAYWNRNPYKGVGLGACSFDGRHRFQNEKNLMHYMKGIEQDSDVTLLCEELTPAQIYLEKIMLGLRRSQGVSWHDLTVHVADQHKNLLCARLDELQQRQLIMRNDQGNYMLTVAGLVVENEIITRLII